MLLLVEGPDGAGKSTLVRQLAKALPNAEVLHRGPPKGHLLDEYEKPLLDYMPGSGRNIICDRWHLGEWIYPLVLHRDSSATYVLKHHIEMFLRARGAVVVYVTQPLTVLMSRLEERGDDLIEVRHLRTLRALYEKVIGETSLPMIGNGTSVEAIINIATRVEYQAQSLKSTGSYIGQVLPYNLLVGERTAFEAPYPPAFGPYPATSGDWMLSGFQRFTARWWLRYGFANAFEEDLAGLWRELCHPKVVALGRKASDQLHKAGVTHGSVPHPQYVRRFHHHEHEWYAGLVQRASMSGEDLSKWRP